MYRIIELKVEEKIACLGITFVLVSGVLLSSVTHSLDSLNLCALVTLIVNIFHDLLCKKFISNPNAYVNNKIIIKYNLLLILLAYVFTTLIYL